MTRDRVQMTNERTGLARRIRRFGTGINMSSSGLSCLGETVADVFDQIVLSSGGGRAECIHDGARRGTAVADHDRAEHAEHQGAAVLLVVHTLYELTKNRLREPATPAAGAVLRVGLKV